MTTRTDAEIRPVLHAAMALVAAGGLKGLSLRPLAERMGTTVSALSHRFGLKDELIAALIDAARDEDDEFLDGWLARIRVVGPLDGALLADLTDAILADMVGPHATRTLFYCELLLGAPSRPEIAAPLAAWRARRLAFWRAAAEPLDRPELGGVLHAFSTDEAAHGLALGDLAAYRWLRRLALHRLCGAVVPLPGSSDLRQFAVFHDMLGELMQGPDGYRPPQLSEQQAAMAGHISKLIIAEGVDAVTHRAIAARVGVASSTLAYHFPRQEDLLKAGLEDIIVRMHGRVYRPAHSYSTADEDLSSVEISRATFALTLAAARMPSLKACAADTRRRRGENLLFILNRQVVGESPFDLLSAQALSITGIGQIILDGLLEGAPDTIDFSLIDQLRAIALAAR